jgi:hypothetical protein
MGQAMVRVQEFFDRLNRGERWRGRVWPGGYHLALQVHDELVPDMPSGRPWVGKRVVGTDGARLIEQAWQYNLPVAREVKRLMEVGGDNIGVPTPVSMEWHETSWAEGVSV